MKIFTFHKASQVLLILLMAIGHVIAQDNPDASDCVRGQAEPVLKKEIFPNSFFKLNEDGISGIETTDLKNGDKLIITNEGCEYFVLSFRFETSRFQGAPSDVNFWASKLVDLMTEITDGVKSPLELKKGTAALKKYITKNRIKLSEEISFEEPDEISAYVTIERIQKIDNKKYELEISFIVGPL